ncbi:hypothetical protein [Methylobacterium sp. J-090]|uniref:hypothetical protein n=1 Tax=Methylobacterium sp. J-090 TaxID=2836666 RepID=UPI001FB90963|nr:hypothetical protein [Methylobacterium sp. J-090]MCJ2080758.1 hypothetical protein [Methylobacterium sp. J-090]
MSDAPIFGTIDQRFSDEPLPTGPVSFSKIAFVSTSTGADDDVFPAGVSVDPTSFLAVRFSSSNKAFTEKLGTGYLADAVRAVNAQLSPGSQAADITVIRVAEGGTLNETMANVIAGLRALKAAPIKINATPRLVGVPGYTAQRLTGVSALGLTNRGTGFTAAPTVSLTGGGGTGATATATISQGVASATVGAGGAGYTVATVLFSAPAGGGTRATATATIAGGAVTSLTITNKGHGYGPAEVPTITITGDGTGATATAVMTGVIEALTVTNGGSGYTGAPTVAFTGGAGTGATATGTVTVLANPVVAALPEVLSALLAIAVVDVDDSSRDAAIDAREDMGSDRIMPVGVAARVFDVDGATVVTRPMAPRILGLITRVDFQNGGKPFEPFANRQIFGLVGTSRAIEFDLRDGSVEGQQLLAAEVSIVVRGETDVDGAIADGGFVFIGTDNCASDGDLWQQIHQVRGADIIDVEHMRLTRQYLGRKISASNAEAWINALKFNLRDHKADDDVLGYKTEFKADENSPEEVRLGRLAVDLGIEEAPVFRVAKRNVRRYRQAVNDLVADIAARINASTIL